MSNMQCGKALLLLPLILPAMAVGQVLNVPLVVQEQTEWCWAADSSAILQFYGHPQSQCAIADYTRTVATWHDFGAVNCCADPGRGCNYWNYNYGYPGSMQDILAHWGVSNYGISRALEIPQIQTEITAGRPFIIRWLWMSGSGHFIVGHGIIDQSIYFMNPWPGEGLKIGDYDWVRSGGTHTWTHTSLMSISRSHQLAVNPGGAAKYATAGRDGPIRAGYVKIALDSGTTPYGIGVFSLRQNEAVISEAGIPASPPTTRARVFIDFRNGVNAIPSQDEAGLIDVNTGIALVNNGSETADVTYALSDVSGNPITAGHGTIAAGKYFACFVDELKEKAEAPDFSLPADFATAIQFGSLEITSTQPLSVLGLRGTMNQKNEFIMTTTPVADLTRDSGDNPIYFPQFVDGGGYTTSITLLNASSEPETGTIEIRDGKGEPFVVNQAGGTAGSLFKYSIPPGGSYRLQTDGFPIDVKAGWVRLIPDKGTMTPIGSGVFGYSLDRVLVSESGIPSAISTTHARIYLDLTRSHNTGLALANLVDADAEIVIKAYESDGITPIGEAPVPLDPNGYAAAFADEFIDGLPAGFTGVLDVRSETPFAALTLRTLMNERHKFLMTTFPVADAQAEAPAPVVFPQVVDGGGYLTEFILISAGGAAGATLNFFGANGTPVDFGE